MRKLLIILGVPIDNLNMTEALDRIEDFIRIGRKTGKTHQVATVNADFAVKASRDPELRYLLQESDMATADGMPLVWGVRALGMHIEERVAGADMIPALAERAAKNGYSMYFFGAAEGVAAQAADILKSKYPDLKVAGVCSPPYGSILEMDQQIIADIRKSKPDILLVALGNPKQEKWIGMYGREVGAPVAIGIGGTLDFIAGRTKRAPLWMQNVGIEWLYRLLQEPRRLWKRYVEDLVGFSSFFVQQWWYMRRSNTDTTILPKSDLIIVDDQAIVTLEGRIDINNYTNIIQKGEAALEITPHLTFNLSRTTFVDSSAMGALVSLAKQARDKGGDLTLENIHPEVFRAFRLLRLDRFFVIKSDPNGEEPIREEHNMPTQGDWAIVTVPRRFDATTSKQVLQLCSSKLEESRNLILDFRDTAFLASAGLAAMAQINRQAQGQQGTVRLINCSHDIQRVIELVRFDKIFTMFDDLKSAMANG